MRGIIIEEDLIHWYEHMIKDSALANGMLDKLVKGFEAEFPHAKSETINDFLKERGYDKLRCSSPWNNLMVLDEPDEDNPDDNAI